MTSSADGTHLEIIQLINTLQSAHIIIVDVNTGILKFQCAENGCA